MKIHLKIGLVVGVALILSLLFVSYQFSDQLEEVHKSERKDRLLAQSHLLKDAVRWQTLESIDRMFSLANIERSITPPNGDELSASPLKSASQALENSPFLGIIQFDQSGSGGWSEKWGRISSSLLQVASVEDWRELKGQIPWERVTPETLTWAVVDGPGQRKYLGVLAKAKSFEVNEGELRKTNSQSIMLGLLPISHLDPLGWWSKMTKSNVIVVDNKGRALAHSEKGYLGAELKGHPAVSRILKLQNNEGELNYSGSEGTDMESYYARVPNSNVYVVIEDPTFGKISPAFNLVLRSILQVLAILLLVWGGITLILRSSFEGVKALELAVIDFLSDQPVRWADKVSAKTQSLIKGLIDHQQSEHEKQLSVNQVGAKELAGKMLKADLKSAYTQISQGISQSIKGPITSIIGYSQLAKAQQEKGEAGEDYLAKITNEARRVREIVGSLTKFSGAELGDEPVVPVVVSDLVGQVLSDFRGLLDSKEIQVEGVGTSHEKIFVRPGLFKGALREVLKNSIEALEGQGAKKIRFRQFSESGEVRVVVEDSGAGCKKIENIFTPFYSEKIEAGHHGLGLTVAQSYIKSLNGDIFVGPSELGGLKVTVAVPSFHATSGMGVVNNNSDGEIPRDVLAVSSDLAEIDVDEDRIVISENDVDMDSTVSIEGVTESEFHNVNEENQDLTRQVPRERGDELDITQAIPVESHESVVEQDLDLTQDIGALAKKSSQRNEDLTVPIGLLNRRASDRDALKDQKNRSSESSDPDEFEMKNMSVNQSQSKEGAEKVSIKATSSGDILLGGKKPVKDESVPLPPLPGEELLESKAVEEERVVFPEAPKEENSDKEAEDENNEPKVKIRPPRLKE